MRASLLSFAVGWGVGLLYAALRVKSPTPCEPASLVGRGDVVIDYGGQAGGIDTGDRKR
jgi:XapX domain-containing protein